MTTLNKTSPLANGSASPTIDLATVQEKFTKTRAEMIAGLVERDVEVDIVLTALLAGHHPLLVGEPGTGKSMLGRAICEWIEAGEWFEILLNKFTDPAELFGPVSLEGLKKDEFRRMTDGTLATATVAFLDEIFKGSPAVLNTSLGVLNERRLRNGRTMLACPLQMAIAASNEWPQDQENGGKELGALWDRFLLRRWVEPVRSPEGQDRLLWDDSLGVTLSTRITPAEIAAARAAALALPVTTEAKQTTEEIIRQLAAEGIRPGDRRKRWSVGACRAFAFLSGADRVERDHLEILSHTFWNDPREQPLKTAQIVAKLANPLGMEISTLIAEARELIGQIDRTDFSTVLTSLKKLESVAKKLKAKSAHPKAKDAHEYVAKQIQKIKAEAVSGGMV